MNISWWLIADVYSNVAQALMPPSDLHEQSSFTLDIIDKTAELVQPSTDMYDKSPTRSISD